MVITWVCFIIALSSGLWLSHLGRPLNQIFFTLHKLIALATVIFAVLVMYTVYQNIEIDTLRVILCSILVLLFLILFVTGAVLSAERPLPEMVLLLHKIGTVLTGLWAALLIILV
jgi:hypothetical protein